MAPPPPGRVLYIVPVVDFDSQLYAPTEVPAVALIVCTSAACTTPFTDWQRLDGPAPFVWVLSFPAGLSNAVLRFSAPGYVPMDYVLGGPMVGTPAGDLTVKGVGVPLLKEATLASLYAQVGLPMVDLTRGTYAARVLTCDGVRATQATVQPTTGDVASPAVAFSLSNNNLATASSLETDQRGVAGFFNLPPQTLDVQGWTDTGVALGSATTVLVRPGVVTLSELRPGLDQWGQ